MRLTPEERETIILYNEAEDTASVLVLFFERGQRGEVFYTLNSQYNSYVFSFVVLTRLFILKEVRRIR